MDDNADPSLFSYCVGPQAPEYQGSFEHHTDWVNDILLCQDGKTGVRVLHAEGIVTIRAPSSGPL